MASKKAPTSKSKKRTVFAGGAQGFLSKAWPGLFAATKKVPYGRSADAILAKYRLWGWTPPGNLAAFVGPLAKGTPPPLAELLLETNGPVATPKKGNLAEARIVAAQEYPPLWMEIFAGLTELGSTSNGDVWMVTDKLNDEDEQERVYLWNHETYALESPPQADSLEAFVYRAALCGAEAAGDIDEPSFAASRVTLTKRVGHWAFEGTFDDVEPFAPEDPIAWDIAARAAWLITVLSEKDPSDAEIRGAVDREMVQPLTAKDLARRRRRFETYPPTAFYFGLTAYFTGEDERLGEIITMMKPAKSPIMIDLRELLSELASGKRKALGNIADVRALRERVAMLDVLAPRDRARALSADEKAHVERAAKERSLADLAWKHLDDPAIHAAIENVWLKDPKVGKSVALIGKMRRQEDGYRDEAVISEWLAKGDRATLPLLIGRVLDPGGNFRFAAFDVIASSGDARAIPPLAPLGKAVNRFHHERYALAKLVHRANDPHHARALLDILQRFPATDNGNHEMLPNVVIALGQIGAKDALPQLRKLADTDVAELGSETQIGLRDAVLYSLAELGADDLLPALMKRADGNREIYQVAGLNWALGRLAMNADAKVKAKVRKRLEECGISKRTLASKGKTRQRSVDGLLDVNLGGQAGDIAREIAAEHSLVLLGDDIAPLKKLVSHALAHGDEWSGYDSYMAMTWALLALESQPQIGKALAKPHLTSTKALHATIAHRILGER